MWKTQKQSLHDDPQDLADSSLILEHLSGQQTPRKRQKEQSENYLRSQWEETRFTDLTVMTTQRLSAHSTFPQGRSTK